MVEKHVNVKVREGTVKDPVKVFGKSLIKMTEVNYRKGWGWRGKQQIPQRILPRIREGSRWSREAFTYALGHTWAKGLLRDHEQVKNHL